MTHGTLSGYIHGNCRCEPCTDANRVQNRKRRNRFHERTVAPATPQEREARRYCLICQTPLLTHPLKSCWRTI